MKTVIRYRNVAKLSRPDLHQMIERLAERVLAPHLSHFPTELLRLHATLDRSRQHGLYRVRLQITVRRDAGVRRGIVAIGKGNRTRLYRAGSAG
ncbi:hypothetical protein [Caballeronia novacaledonica]|uniref:Uncharacterized protein n=1 Tax=Caballeronia novacaledonica TaxID=1544861 RepID=A0AA37MIP7_9BURK|nr:hypothetical protein [Caballeronia novacaledonica]GJH28860.1 hypothetical protein CBA19CS42_30110 [Caballeronia novacaledonica]